MARIHCRGLPGCKLPLMQLKDSNTSMSILFLYISTAIKSANILIDKDFHAKVADFGLTKLTEVGSTSFHTRLVGTFGYMPPEYAQYGDVSPKVDV
ncbi:lysM domain receptor-like kinase 3 isoform X2 [Lycium ferocissimum]|uniref:lysM domain receptor-like kinase 3 isoform X2 n=1 Tax=Lycium ferocissimum TaxID=112874 RepID=UPI0028154DD3|nr:lysM domain receptor-like kinase 3 isoform X2 [Lycium ferocissimum]